ncbi:MAG TPA: bifunctional hydroxymethylpyrimidine kinase/phosphomethylpyrimidine kinase [Pseudonocardiaceae bacterium]
MIPGCLVVASSDSLGGAGVQADGRALASVGCLATTVVTAVTAQTGTELRAVHRIPDDILCAQFAAAVAAHRIDAVKLGSLTLPPDLVDDISALCLRTGCPLVVDPVLVTAAGDTLCDTPRAVEVLTALRGAITVLTPNGREAAILAGTGDRARDALILSERFGTAVVVTGGDLADGADTIVVNGQPRRIPPSLPPRAAAIVHGAGCTYSALLTGLLAQRIPLVDALDQAKSLTDESVHNGLELATGVVVPFTVVTVPAGRR